MANNDNLDWAWLEEERTRNTAAIKGLDTLLEIAAPRERPGVVALFARRFARRGEQPRDPLVPTTEPLD